MPKGHSQDEKEINFIHMDPNNRYSVSNCAMIIMFLTR